MLTISCENNKVKVQDETNSFNFDVNDTVNLNSFIKYISGNEDILSCNPDCYELFQETYTGNSPESLKLVEYLYKIIHAFNKCFRDVFQSENENKTDEDEEQGFQFDESNFVEDDIPF